MSKILFTDLDGTLLKDNKQISGANREAIKKMMEAGHYFVICTGRPVASGRMIARELGLTEPGCYMVCFNGGVIYNCAEDKVEKAFSLEMQDVERLFEEAKKVGLHIHSYDDQSILAVEHTEELDYYRFKSNMQYKLIDDVKSGIKEAPQKCLLCSLTDHDKLQKFKDDNAYWADERMSSFFTCMEYLEYVPKGVDKGAGVRLLSEFLNVSIENVVAIGDERNDIAMLQAAHIGVAMKNSQEDVFAYADAVTEKDNNHDGVAEAIYKYILN